MSKEILKGDIKDRTYCGGTGIAANILGTSFPAGSTAVTHLTLIATCSRPLSNSKPKLRVCLLAWRMGHRHLCVCCSSFDVKLTR
jgi:hypothetical protein